MAPFQQVSNAFAQGMYDALMRKHLAESKDFAAVRETVIAAVNKAVDDLRGMRSMGLLDDMDIDETDDDDTASSHTHYPS